MLPKFVAFCCILLAAACSTADREGKTTASDELLSLCKTALTHNPRNYTGRLSKPKPTMFMGFFSSKPETNELNKLGVAPENCAFELLSAAVKRHDYDYRAAAVLGYFFENGIGTPVDLDKAIKFYQFSQDATFAPAKYRLGLLYEFGPESLRNLRLANYYYESAYSFRKHPNYRKASNRVRKKVEAQEGNTES